MTKYFTKYDAVFFLAIPFLYIYIYIYIYVYIYLSIYRERDRQIDREREKEDNQGTISKYLVQYLSIYNF